jgi:hypothetical protein
VTIQRLRSRYFCSTAALLLRKRGASSPNIRHKFSAQSSVSRRPIHACPFYGTYGRLNALGGQCSPATVALAPKAITTLGYIDLAKSFSRMLTSLAYPPRHKFVTATATR